MHVSSLLLILFLPLQFACVTGIIIGTPQYSPVGLVSADYTRIGAMDLEDRDNLTNLTVAIFINFSSGYNTTSTITTTTSTTTTTTSTTTTSTSTTTTSTTTTTTTTTTSTTNTTSTTSTSTTTTTTPESTTTSTSNTTTGPPTTTTNTTSTTSTSTTNTTTVRPIKYFDRYAKYTTRTTSTTTPGPLCLQPVDPIGTYVQVPYTKVGTLDEPGNASWNLTCPDGYFAGYGREMAVCLTYGILRPAGGCVRYGCENISEVYWGPTTCPKKANEGESCTVLCGATQERIGWWTCIDGKYRGSPTCLDREGEYWRVIWMRPKITGSFDFVTEIRRGVNASNWTIEPFAKNITEAMADAIDGVAARDFESGQGGAMNIAHMWESKDFIMKGWETGFPTLWKLHIWRVDYQLVIWDYNVLENVRNCMYEILEEGSETRQRFVADLWRSSEMVFVEMYTNAIPIMYNETIVAPDHHPKSWSTASRQEPAIMLLFLIAAGTVILHASGCQNRHLCSAPR